MCNPGTLLYHQPTNSYSCERQHHHDEKLNCPHNVPVAETVQEARARQEKQNA
jgi:hypothetical protein